MSFHLHKSSGLWFVKYYENGKEKRIYTDKGPEGRLAAQEKDAEIKREKARGPKTVVTTDKDATFTFYYVASQYLQDKALSPKSRQAISFAIDKWVEPLFGRKTIAELSMADLVDLNKAMSKAARAQATRNRYRAYCKAIMQWGVNNDIITRNPFAKFRPNIKAENKAPDLITPAELRAILFNAPPHLVWAIKCILNLGVRPGPTELFAIRMSDIDFERGAVWITRPKVKSRRVPQPVAERFLNELKELAAREPGRRYLVEYNGKRVESLKTTWNKTKLCSCIPPTRRLRLHDLRHLFTTTLIDEGADPKAVAELLGHADTTMVMKTYHHLRDQATRAAVNRLPKDW